MAQILDPLPNGQQGQFLCCYVNATNKIQIARITNIEHWYFERVVFPGQRLFFEALPEAMLEIHTGMMASAILSDTIPCRRLSVQESPTKFSGASTEEESAPKKPSKTSETSHKKSFTNTDNLGTAVSFC